MQNRTCLLVDLSGHTAFHRLRVFAHRSTPVQAQWIDYFIPGGQVRQHHFWLVQSGSAHAEMLGEYGDIDIALDTFPFNGGMTTLEALWMGVPVVTMAGNTVVSRQTVSALINIGLADELAFASVETYIAGAVALANVGFKFLIDIIFIATCAIGTGAIG